MSAFVFEPDDGVLLACAAASEVIASDRETPGLTTLARCEAMADAGLFERTGTHGELHTYEITERGLQLLRAGLTVGRPA